MISLEILFRQNISGDSLRQSVLDTVGIERSYLKRFYPEKDRPLITVSTHHHTCYEIHIVEIGCQVYSVGDKKITINEGEFLFIPPFMKHCVLESTSGTLKYGLAFNVREGSELSLLLSGVDNYTHSKLPDAVKENIDYICKEKKHGKIFHRVLISNRIFECITLFLRAVGIKNTSVEEEEDGEDIRVSLAKQYVSDNIQSDITVRELAAYCCVCPKQLSRIFKSREGMTAAEYIRKERYLYIEELLTTSSLSLREISESMNFNNEYYFNSFFKKYSGMSPGNYRKWVTKDQ